MKQLVFIVLIKLSLFATYTGDIIDKITLKPIQNAMVSDSINTVYSNEYGVFKIDSNESKFHIKKSGYRRLSFSSDLYYTMLTLEPITVKALYLSFWGAQMNSKRMKKIIHIIENSQVNAIVLDVKNEYGSTSYKTSVKLANSYGAFKKSTNKCIKTFIKLMKEKNIYTIARISTFKDELQASNNPQYAIKNKYGEIWRNYDKMAWVDPFDERSHKYTLDIAEDAAKIGFDEINFDYIRFPATKNLVFSKENTEKNRLKAIETFVDSAQKILKPYGVFISVDIYGATCWEKNDVGIGQKISSLVKYADYLAPMLYPSGFSSGSFNRESPSSYPYEVINKSINNIDKEINLKQIRPWLQYFQDYAHNKKQYKRYEIQEQIRATKDSKTSGWMMWSPSSRYHLNSFSNSNINY
jgi:hypothetical protein